MPIQLMLLGLLATSAGRAAIDRPALAEVDAYLQSEIAPDTPGAAVMLVDHGEIVFAKGYGLANVAEHVPVTPQTVFDVGSVSKQFTAMAIMMLAEQGELSYDDSLSKFLPEFPAYAANITVRHLLHHTGGLPDYMAAFERTRRFAPGFMPTTHDAVRLLAEQPRPDFAPGDQWAYSNSGYVVLAAIVEAASGQRFPDFVRENIFEPLGMRHSLVMDENVQTAANRAISYAREATGFTDIDAHPLNLIYGDGAVNTTIEDLFLWDQALATEKLVKASTRELAFTSGKRNDGTDTGYGFGWAVGQFFGRRCVSHGGAWVGFRAFIMRLPAQEFSVVIEANLAQADPEAMAKRVARIYLHAQLELPQPVAVAASVLASCVGEYDLERGGSITITRTADGRLHLSAPGNRDLALLASSSREFFGDGREDVRVSFECSGDRVTGLVYHTAVDRQARKVK
ncbi:MAG: serine hydrolase domain-containing protein [Planctomycetota bacterium]